MRCPPVGKAEIFFLFSFYYYFIFFFSNQELDMVKGKEETQGVSNCENAEM
jgi:hypothetical protein